MYLSSYFWKEAILLPIYLMNIIQKKKMWYLMIMPCPNSSTYVTFADRYNKPKKLVLQWTLIIWRLNIGDYDYFPLTPKVQDL
jgi:hypothetical protein